MSEPFDWAAAMAFGLGVLKLPPAVFWAMTPRELEAALAGHHGRRAGPAPSRLVLSALMQQFPDNRNAEEREHE